MRRSGLLGALLLGAGLTLGLPSSPAGACSCLGVSEATEIGLSFDVVFTGTVSAFMVERLRAEDRKVDWDQLSDHVVICGWSSKGEIILEELRASR